MECETTTAAEIPRRLAPCFQEYDLERLDPEEHSDLIIERTLAYGDRRALRWLWQRYRRERIRAWVKRDGLRRLPWRRYTLWCVLLDLPRAPHPRSEEQRIWPY
ncbi:MAG TPA: hypothetical protein G4N98_00520 [Thermoflexia bacterium]|nr:hypothetical protein [Thermoflexia bacterium]